MDRDGIRFCELKLVSGDSGARYSDLSWLRDDTALFAEVRLTPLANRVLDTGEADLAYRWQAEVFAVGNGKLLVHQDGPQLAFATLVGDEKLLFISQITENNRTASMLKLTGIADLAARDGKSSFLMPLGSDEITGLSASADGRVVSVMRKWLSPIIYVSALTTSPVGLKMFLVCPLSLPHLSSRLVAFRGRRAF